MGKKGDRAAKEKLAGVSLDEEGKNVAKKPDQHGEEEYRCTGVLEQDFNELCSRAGFTKIPKVTVRLRSSTTNLFPADESDTLAEKEVPASLTTIQSKYAYFQPCLQTELEHDDPKSTREIFVRGWKMEEKMLGVLSKCLPALANLQAVHLWKVGLTDLSLLSLIAILPNCPNLKTLTLEGNPLAEGSFYKLIGEESTLAHVSLRNNSIGDAQARRIGQALSTLRSCNNSLVSLTLSFNHISDLGAGYIAEGLRLNRSLLSLSLAHNHIGDPGALKLAEVLGPFALTHTEVVERRRLLLEKELQERSRSPLRHADVKSIERPSSLISNTTIDKLQAAKQSKTTSKKKELLKKEEKAQGGAAGAGGVTGGPALAPAKKEDPKQAKKWNQITEQGLKAFLAAMESQQQAGKATAGVKGQMGLLRLSLGKNRFPAESKTFAKLQELMLPRNPILRQQQPKVSDDELVAPS
ncbi:leucine-rich repeat-containing protein 71 isoform X3 [Carettochelys insculpta]|uniref:leucine-rich repeat-containing protein 71 isoform X3 n=1 Tax=Carettochelys insculpta TaxID=44489 RepID=UPI003EBD0495